MFFKDLPSLYKKACHSAFYRKALGWGLGWLVPFNRAHGFQVIQVSENSLSLSLPYKRGNLNHIQGLHACALATLAELSSGVLLLSKLDPARYRIILKSLHMDYFYQAKESAFATFSLTDDWMKSEIFIPLENTDSVLIKPEVIIKDKEGRHLCTGTVEWQIKSWQKVKTKS
jgi:hypothetical protein